MCNTKGCRNCERITNDDEIRRYPGSNDLICQSCYKAERASNPELPIWEVLEAYKVSDFLAEFKAFMVGRGGRVDGLDDMIAKARDIESK